MGADSNSTSAHVRRARKAHETTDASVGWILISGVIVAAVLMVVHLISHRIARSRPASNIAIQVAEKPGSNFPRLQVAPAIDLANFKSKEERELNEYAWVNRTAGIARIPIPLAMDLVLKRGFPVRQAGAPAKTGPSEAELIEQSRLATNQSPSNPK